jgi:hypothetical protein
MLDSIERRLLILLRQIVVFVKALIPLLPFLAAAAWIGIKITSSAAEQIIQVVWLSTVPTSIWLS